MYCSRKCKCDNNVVVLLRCLVLRQQQYFNRKAALCMTTSIVQCCINFNAWCSVLQFFTKETNTYVIRYQQQPLQNLNLPTVYYCFSKGPLRCWSVSNWAVWVIMWVLEIATYISQVCDPAQQASDSLSQDLNQQLAQHSLSPSWGPGMSAGIKDKGPASSVWIQAKILFEDLCT